FLGGGGASGISLAAARRALRDERWTVALDFQGLWKSAAWARASGAARRIGFAASDRREPLSRLLLTELHPRPSAAVHVIDKNLALLAALGLDEIGRRDFPLPPLDRASQRVETELAAMQLDRPVWLHPGGGWPSKLWPPERYSELAGRLGRRGLPTLVTWGPGEEELAERVVAGAGGGATKAFPATLLELAALATRARLLVAADTGPLHLAAAVGTPLVALFGPTDPARNGPFDPRDRVLRREPPCFPCHRRDCPRHAGVLREIPVDEVERAVLERLEGAPKR
ncbi:MAG: glycosyltransferase family 9 protein, partial [Thermoanaerobaculia bacterium]